MKVTKEELNRTCEGCKDKASFTIEAGNIIYYLCEECKHNLTYELISH